MFYFAYDGSINGDWVSHYAIHLVAGHPDKSLHLLHVDDGQTSESSLNSKLQRLRGECNRAGVKLVPDVVTSAGDVYRAIRSHVPPGPQHALLCGLRVRSQKQGLLRGTVSERLLRSQHCNVLAVRVVQPGLLGVPRRLLWPITDNSHRIRFGLPFLEPPCPTACATSYHAAHSGRAFALATNVASRHRTTSHACSYLLRERRAANHRPLWLEPKPIGCTRGRLGRRGKGNRRYGQQDQVTIDLHWRGGGGVTQQFFRGRPIEQILRSATCDVAVYRGVE